MELDLTWENAYAGKEEVIGNRTESISDAYVKCLSSKACVDIEYIAALSASTPKDVIERLKGSIYQNPLKWDECFYKGWETADEYLSGNIREKIIDAAEADRRYNGYFADNVKALKKVLPPEVSADDIYITLGSPWVPADVIEDFIRHIEHRDYGYRKVMHDELTGTWAFDFSCKDAYYYVPYENREKFGTSRRNVFELLLKTLNMQNVAVYDSDTVYTDSFQKPKKVRKINKEETTLAFEKQKALIEEFQEWVWSDAKRKKRLESIYTEKYGSIKQRHFDGSFLELPGMNPEISLYQYQKDAAARIIFSPNTLLAHDVGAGKTFIMIAAGMEMKRLGISQKNLYVVPNNIVGQWDRMFRLMYPLADVLCIDPKDFTEKKRDAVLAKIRTGSYDAVIMAYSSFTKIPLSRKWRIRLLQEDEDRYVNVRCDRTKNNYKVENTLERIRNEIDELRGEAEDGSAEFFEELGITRLFVDEAHNFKNVPIDTKIENVMGISRTGSQKCKDMMNKVRTVQMLNGGAGVIFATGTPITNSITDAYIMQMYLQSGGLALLELESFDSWVGMFAEKTTGFEIDVDTSQYRLATRFAKFHNIPELTNLFAQIADFHPRGEDADIPDLNGYDDVVVHRTADFAKYLQTISERADAIRSGQVNRKDDNMLLVTTDGRKAALDMRLVDGKASFTTMSKVFSCAENVARIYKMTSLERSTQLIFCDTSTPKEGFNIYDELKGLLVKMGVPAAEIRYVHEAGTDRQREKLFEAMRQGTVRVLVGSTFKLGLGVNVQTKLIALHHLDVPWRPADMMQREGRILRQGNENSRVWIFRYITEGSFDAYSWQLLETKQRFITDILSGTIDEREGSDVDDTVLDYGEVKALAVGNPLIKKRVEVANELTKHLILQRKAEHQKRIYEKELAKIPKRLEKLNELIPLIAEDEKAYRASEETYTKEEQAQLRKEIFALTHLSEPSADDVIVCIYKGFTVTVPADNSTVKPFVVLTRSGRYTVPVTNNENLCLSKIDQCLEGLKQRLDDLRQEKKDALAKTVYMKNQLRSGEDYLAKIESIRKELARIDKELGI
ncbi:MAG: DEAD/DEAH box helicase family protein [Lachnospiraceae bacterium]|nr:DEAD/DEAH box helicase family protein [Lachnospiraceae bacterium]